MVEKELSMDCDSAIEYIIENVKAYDYLELSYNRVFSPGEVLNIDTSKYHGENGCKVVLHVSEDTYTSTVHIDLEEVKDDLIEVVHTSKESGDKTTILIDSCISNDDDLKKPFSKGI